VKAGKVKVKVKLSLCTPWIYMGYLLHSVSLLAPVNWVGYLHPDYFTPWERVPTWNKSMGGFQRVWMPWRRENIVPLPRIKQFIGCLACNLVIAPTVLSWPQVVKTGAVKYDLVCLLKLQRILQDLQHKMQLQFHSLLSVNMLCKNFYMSVDNFKMYLLISCLI